MAMALTAAAQTQWQVGDVVPTMDETVNLRVLSVTGENKYTAEAFANPASKPAGLLSLPYMFIKGDAEFKLTAIAEKGFQGCDRITSVMFPRDLESIGANAFYGCTHLAEISDKTNLNDVTGLGEGAFAYTYALDSICFKNLEQVPKMAFMNSGVKRISLPSAITIGGAAFQNCESLERVHVTDELRFVENMAFYGCTSLEGFRTGSNLWQLGTQCFAGCTSLRSIVVPSGLTRVGTKVFSDAGLERLFVFDVLFQEHAPDLDILGCTGINHVYTTRELLVPLTTFLAGTDLKDAMVQDVNEAVLKEEVLPKGDVSEPTDFTLTPQMEDISDLTVTDPSGAMLTPVGGVYTTSAASVTVSYTAGDWDALQYVIDLSEAPIVGLESVPGAGISTQGGVLRVSGISADACLQVADMSGRVVYSSCSASHAVPLACGIYLVRVGNDTGKIMIK